MNDLIIPDRPRRGLCNNRRLGWRWCRRRINGRFRRRFGRCGWFSWVRGRFDGWFRWFGKVRRRFDRWLAWLERFFIDYIF
jgi:hypothetical protein